MLIHPRYTKGFTLVELLIVIVIIGVLASLVVSVYGGVQLRARNAQTLTAVNFYYKSLVNYAREMGAYPSGGCLGDDYPTSYCFRDVASSPSAANTALRSYLKAGKLALPGLKSGATYATDGSVGAYLWNSGTTNIDGVAQYQYLVYAIEGDGNGCSIGPSARITASWPTLSLNPPDTSTASSGKYKECWYPLPNIANL